MLRIRKRFGIREGQNDIEDIIDQTSAIIHFETLYFFKILFFSLTVQILPGRHYQSIHIQ